MPGRPTPGRFGRKTVAGLAVLALAILAFVAWRRISSGRQSTGEEIRSATVQQKDFVRSVRLNGIVEAVESHTVAAPRLSGQGLGTLIISHLIKSGTTVKKGDVLVEFDRQAQIRNVLDKQAEYRDLVEQIHKMQADQAAARAADDTALKQAEDAVKNAELEVKKNDILSRIDAEKNQENLDEARATYAQLKDTYNLKRQAAQADLKILEIQRDRSAMAMKWSQGNSQKMLIRAVSDGVAVLNPIWKSGSMGEVQEGDEVRPGVPFMQVVNPGRMQVRAKVNQADISGLHPGQNVTIHLDAYPELSFPGTLESIAAVAISSNYSDRVHTFVATFSIHGVDPRLLPDLSAAVDVELERDPGVLVAPRDAVVSQNGHNYVRMKSAFGYDKHEVKLGPANDTEQVIASGLEKGAVVQRNPSL